MFMVAAALGGASIVILRQRLLNAATMQLPVVITIIFGVGLVVGAGTVLIGLSLHTLWGTLLERAGLTALSLLMLVYSAVTLDYYGIRAFVSALFFISFSAACVWRFIQIGQDLTDVESNIVGDAVKALNTDDTKE